VLLRNRRTGEDEVATIQREIGLRKEAERQFQVLMENSPAAILLLDGEGGVLTANPAAERLFAAPPRGLDGASIAPLVPVLLHVCSKGAPVRGVMDARGKRRNGEAFAASIWYSVYDTAEGRRVSAILADATEGVREEHEEQLRQVLTSGAVLAGAFAHEIGNLSAALRISHSRLGERAGLQSDADYRAMTTLLAHLSHLASLELRHNATAEVPVTPLSEVLSDLRMMVAPWLEESGVTATWPEPRDLPAVQADARALAQVFMNLVKNSLRALERLPNRRLWISAEVEGSKALLAVQDSGPGVADASRLFRPFQPGAEATGLGLYVSRALVRGFAGELRYEPRQFGSRFVIELQIATGDYGKSDGYSSCSAAG
jgi:PAS domain S-box-containing protein